MTFADVYIVPLDIFGEKAYVRNSRSVFGFVLTVLLPVISVVLGVHLYHQESVRPFVSTTAITLGTGQAYVATMVCKVPTGCFVAQHYNTDLRTYSASLEDMTRSPRGRARTQSANGQSRRTDSTDLGSVKWKAYGFEETFDLQLSTAMQLSDGIHIAFDQSGCSNANWDKILEDIIIRPTELEMQIFGGMRDARNRIYCEFGVELVTVSPPPLDTDSFKSLDDITGSSPMRFLLSSGRYLVSINEITHISRSGDSEILLSSQIPVQLSAHGGVPPMPDPTLTTITWNSVKNCPVFRDSNDGIFSSTTPFENWYAAIPDSCSLVNLVFEAHQNLANMLHICEKEVHICEKEAVERALGMLATNYRFTQLQLSPVLIVTTVSAKDVTGIVFAAIGGYASLLFSAFVSIALVYRYATCTVVGAAAIERGLTRHAVQITPEVKLSDTVEVESAGTFGIGTAHT